MRLSIFTDELGIDITEGISILKDWGLTCLDFRGQTFGKATEALDAEELKRLRKLVDDHGMKVTCLESSLAKVHLPEADRVAAEMAKLENILRAADVLDCRLVRAFFFWQPKGEDRGQLAVRPDMLQRVMDLAGPMCRRARQGGLVVAFENCGVAIDENVAVLDALGYGEFGHAWDPANEWLGGEPPSDAGIAQRAARTRCVHVKAAGLVPGLAKVQVPWDKVLRALAQAGYRGPVSIETHNPDKSVDRITMSRRVLEGLQAAWPGGAPAVVTRRELDFKPVRFVVAGMGKGKTDARKVQKTVGTELAGVCDIRPEAAQKAGKELGVEWTSDLRAWLDRKDVDAVYVVTETGNHGAVAIQALQAGKHVIVTKPMEANVAACDRMIAEARKAGRLLAVDFSMRLTGPVQRMKQRLAEGKLGRLLAGNLWLKIRRTDEYFQHNGGWRGTWKLDGGGAMSNQCIHHIDELIYVLGMPRRVSMRMWTQVQKIEAEDLAMATWEYADGAIVQVSAATTHPCDSWYTALELHGTDGAAVRNAAGPYSAPIERWFLDGQWESGLPPAPSAGWDCLAQNLAAAIRTGAPLLCDGPDGRRSRWVLDNMYKSAAADGAWMAI